MSNCSLSEVQRGQIIVLHKEGYTEHGSGEQLGCRKTALQQAIVKVNRSGTHADQNEVVVPEKQLSQLTP